LGQRTRRMKTLTETNGEVRS